jgi:hypothetical protein
MLGVEAEIPLWVVEVMISKWAVVAELNPVRVEEAGLTPKWEVEAELIRV